MEDSSNNNVQEGRLAYQLGMLVIWFALGFGVGFTIMTLVINIFNWLGSL